MPSSFTTCLTVDWLGDNKFTHCPGSTPNVDTGYSYSDDKWMHVRIDFDSTNDNYKPYKWRTGQTSNDYFIHENWTDQDVRTFRKIVRLHNITIRYVISKIKDKNQIWKQIKSISDPLKLLYFYENKIGYKKNMEKWSAIHNTFKFFKLGRPPQLEIIENGSGWGCRIKVMNRIKNYYKRK